MNFIHSRDYLNEGDVVVLNCDTQCNFMLTDDGNFSSYQRGERRTYYAWHILNPSRAHPSTTFRVLECQVDLGGGGANIRYSLNIIRRG